MTEIKFRRQLSKTGTSLGITIPMDIVESMGLKLHQKVIVEPRDDGIFLRIEGAVPDAQN